MGAGGINPLGQPGGDPSAPPENTSGLMPGQFVKARIDGTAFFLQMPRGNAEADQLLDKGTQMKVIESGESFSKVELDSGAIGYVLTAILEPVTLDAVSEPDAGPDQPVPPVVDPLPDLPPAPVLED